MIRKSFTFEGKRYFVKAKTEKEADEKLIRRKIELEEGRKRITKNMLFKDWFEEWLITYKEPTVGSGWYKNIISIGNSALVPDIGRFRLKDLKPIHIQRILNDRASLSSSYLKLIRVVVKDCLECAMENGLLLENPARTAVIPKSAAAQARRSLTPKERHFILKTCEKHRAGLFYKIMLYCGLRPGEVAALQWKNVDLKTRILIVDSAVKPDGTVGPPKSDAGFRKVPIPEVLAKDLEVVKGKPFDLVCTNAGGGRLTTNSMRQQWKSFRYRLNIEMGCKTFKGGLIPPYPVADDLVPYCLRHTYCTDLQAAGVPINVARELMGHSDISVTSKIYTHSSAESFADAAAAIDQLQKRREKSENDGQMAASKG